jgi:hypothetical protein
LDSNARLKPTMLKYLKPDGYALSLALNSYKGSDIRFPGCAET